MADTKRTKTYLTGTSFPDNSTGQITAQDVRDLVESTTPSFGSLYFSTPVETVISDASTYVKALGTTTVGTVTGVTHSNNRLTYTGVTTIHAHIAASVSMTCASNNKVIGIGIAKNGTMLESSKLHRKVSTGSDIGSAAVHSDTSLDTDDYLELWISNETDTANATIELGYLFFLGMLT